MEQLPLFSTDGKTPAQRFFLNPELPEDFDIRQLSEKYEIHDEFHANLILKNHYPAAYLSLCNYLYDLKISQNDIQSPGGGKSPISEKFDNYFYGDGWAEQKFTFSVGVNGEMRHSESHKVDYFRSGVAVELEWNNKDTFFDRDLSNFRLLHERRTISVGVIITRTTELQGVFDKLGKGASYSNSTTNMAKLLPKVASGHSGTCPLLIVGIKPFCYEAKMEEGTGVEPDPGFPERSV